MPRSLTQESISWPKRLYAIKNVLEKNENKNDTRLDQLSLVRTISFFCTYISSEKVVFIIRE